MEHKNWVHYLRKRDLKKIFGYAKQSKIVLIGPVLEIGCGDGFLTNELRKVFGEVTPIDPKPRAEIDGIIICSAEKIPLKDNSINFIFSSNVLEHVENINVALEEMKRILSPDGIMIHTIPTVTWKIFQILLFPIHLIKTNYTKILIRNSQSNNLSIKKPKTENGLKYKRNFLSKLIPPIHGISKSNIDELHYFTKSNWRNIFHDNDFSLVMTKPLFFHSAYRLLPFKFLWIRKIISYLGCSSVRAYYLINKN